MLITQYAVLMVHPPVLSCLSQPIASGCFVQLACCVVWLLPLLWPAVLLCLLYWLLHSFTGRCGLLT
jgi:hypothetical protein